MFSQEVWFIPILYIAAFITIITVGKSMKQGGALVNVVFAMLALGLSITVFIERLRPHTLDYSFHLDWLVIGEVYYTIGYEITNLNTWLLTLITGVYFLIHIVAIKKKSPIIASSIYAYMSLLMFGLSGILLSDSILIFYICSVLVSVSVYLMLVHPSVECHQTLLWRYVLSQLFVHTALLVVIVVLYWYMPDTALQFTMLQNVFGGQAEHFTEAMLAWLSLSIVISIICSTGLFPYLHRLRLVRSGQSMAQLLVITLSFVFVPIYTLIAFADLITASPIMAGKHSISLFEELIGIDVNLMPVLWMVILIGIAVSLGPIYSKRWNEKVEKRLMSDDGKHLNKVPGSIGGAAIQTGSYIVQWVAMLEHILYRLCTVWLLYPLRRISHMSANTTIMRTTIWMIIVVTLMTGLYTWMGRG